MDNRADPLKADLNGNLALHMAASHGCPHTIAHLMPYGGIDVKNHPGDYPMHIAAWKGNVKIIQEMLNDESGKRHVDLRRESDASTALGIACMRGFCPMVSLLVHAGADVNVQIPTELETPLHLAVSMASSAHANIVRFLLNHSSNVHSKTKSGLTPFLLAALKGSEHAMISLLEAGASLEDRSTFGWSALMVACENRHAHIARHLLGRRGIEAILNVQRNDGRTALHLAVQNAMVDIAEELLSKGADSSIKNVGGATALDLANEMDNHILIGLLRRST